VAQLGCSGGGSEGGVEDGAGEEVGGGENGNNGGDDGGDEFEVTKTPGAVTTMSMARRIVQVARMGGKEARPGGSMVAHLTAVQ
jgi:hypothetical protein